jgi:hypothetical protein
VLAAGASRSRAISSPAMVLTGRARTGEALVLMKRPRTIGYRSFLLLAPRLGKSLVTMTDPDNETMLANALVRRPGQASGWPPVYELVD